MELRESEAGGRKGVCTEVENPGGTAGVGSEMMSLAWELGSEVPHGEVLESSWLCTFGTLAGGRGLRSRDCISLLGLQ